jgi:hypothetical protein
MKKFIRSIRRAWLVFTVGMFGEYKYNVWDGEIEYVRYEYKDTVYYLPYLSKALDVEEDFHDVT